MKYFDWDEGKNKILVKTRSVSFEDVLIAIEDECLLDVLEHKNATKYPNQKIFVVEIRNYAYLVPFIEDEEKVFLKTIIPSRKATKQYILNDQNHENQ